MQVAFDTNVYINQVIASTRRVNKANLTTRLRTDYSIQKQLSEKKFVQTLSEWGILELRDQLKLQMWEIKCVKEGYHPKREEREARKEIKILNTEIMVIEQLLFELRKTSNMRTSIVNFTSIDEMQSYGLEFFDAILFMQANDANCDYFVTRDGGMLEFSRTKQSSLYNTKIINPNDFCRLLK